MPTLPPGRATSGFSLLEITVVLLLLGLAALLIAPSFTKGLKGMELRTVARDMVTHMKQARTKSIATQTVHRFLLSIDENGRSFYALTDDYEDVLNSYPLPDGVSISAESEERPIRISFYPNGRSSGAEFALRRGENFVVNISVDAVTGFGRVIRPVEEE